MGLSRAFVQAHIASWQRQLSSPYYPHRKYWPTRLFHHAPVENIVAILREGMLRSRADAGNCRPRDVAAPGVIDARVHAHDRVRLYFRPKTPTQYHVEGIRRAADCAYPGAHAPILVMLALDAEAILCHHDVLFSGQNMQLSSTVPGSDEDYFRGIAFDKVFSEGGTGGDRSIIDARAAEVLPASPLDLSICLREIYFRSEPERDTAAHLMGSDWHRWSPIAHVSDALKVFEKRFPFVRKLGLSHDGVFFQFNPRHDLQPLDVRIQVWDADGRLVTDFHNEAIAAQPAGHDRWLWRHALVDGIYLVEVTLDGQQAFRGVIPLNDSLF